MTNLPLLAMVVELKIETMHLRRAVKMRQMLDKEFERNVEQMRRSEGLVRVLVKKIEEAIGEK